MSTRILFVRAVNVGGAKLPMKAFRELLVGLGASNVTTYIASGNAVIDHDQPPEEFDRSVERDLTARFGYVREVMSRTLLELRAAMDAHPFEVVDPANSYLAFLLNQPGPEAIAAAAAVPTGEDRWAVVGRELHLRYASGAGLATLKLEVLAKRLGTVATARNLRTVASLINLADSREAR